MHAPQCIILPDSGSKSTLKVQKLECRVEIHVAMAFVSLRSFFFCDEGRDLDVLFECDMYKGKATAMACDVEVRAADGSVVKRFATQVVDPEKINAPEDEHMKQMLSSYTNSSTTSYDPAYFRMPLAGIRGHVMLVDMQYLVPMEFRAGRYSLEVPTQIPESDIPYSDAAETDKMLAVTCVANTGAPDCKWECGSHKMMTLFSSGNRFSLRTMPQQNSNSNFHISYSVASDFILGNCIVEAPKNKKDDGNFLLFLAPPAEAVSTESLGRNVVFLLDHSGSMGGTPMDAAREALVMALQQLTPKDNFAICQFDDQTMWYDPKHSGGVTPTMPQLVPATGQQLENAQAWARQAQARGLTDILTPVQNAVRSLQETFQRDQREKGTPQLPIIFLITDGAVANEKEICRYVQQHGENIRCFTFAIGPFANQYFLRMLGQIGRGYFDATLYTEGIRDQITALMAKTYCPVLTDVTIGLKGLKDVELYPHPLPDLYIGAPICVSGKYQGKFPQHVIVKGRDASGRVLELTVGAYVAENVPVKKVFAKQQLDCLIAGWWLSDGREAEAIKAKVVDVSVESSVPCPFTQTVAFQTNESPYEKQPQDDAQALEDIPLAEAEVVDESTGESKDESKSGDKSKQTHNDSVLARNRKIWATTAVVGGVVALGTAAALTYAFGSVSATSANAGVEAVMDALTEFGGFAEGFFQNVGNLFERGFDAVGCDQCFKACGTNCNNVCCFDVQSVLFDPLQRLCGACCSDSALGSVCNGCGRFFMSVGNGIANVANQACGVCCSGGFNDIARGCGGCMRECGGVLRPLCSEAGQCAGSIARACSSVDWGKLAGECLGAVGDCCRVVGPVIRDVAGAFK